MKEFKILLENVGGESNGIFNSFLIFIGPILGIFLQIITQNFIDNRKLKKEQINIKKEEMKNELNDFYYPLLQLVRKNSIMHEVLIHEKSHDFRTLIELLKGGNLTSNDKVILKEIIEIDNEINNLILRYKHIIRDDNNLSEALNNASVHFTLLKMAYENKLEYEDKRFEEYVYPRTLDEKIEEKIKQLNTEIN